MISFMVILGKVRDFLGEELAETVHLVNLTHDLCVTYDLTGPDPAQTFEEIDHDCLWSMVEHRALR